MRARLFRPALALTLFVPAAADADEPHENPPATHAAAASHAAPAGSAMHAASAVLARMMRDNAHFAEKHAHGYYERFRDEQHPHATVLGCSDSRFQTNDFFADPDGELFVIRNIGNQVRTNAGSVDYAIHHLRTPLLLIVGHVGCGAVKAAMGDYGAEPNSVRHELDPLHLSILHAKATGTIEEQWLCNVIGNVHQQVADARREYSAEIAADKLVVVGGVYDFRNDLGTGAGRLLVVNVNGESEPAKLAALPFMQEAHAPPSACARCHKSAPSADKIMRLMKDLAVFARSRGKAH